MTEDEMYEKVCRSRFDNVERLLKSIEKRLFKGNGGAPWDVQLDRLNQFKKICIWLFCTTGVMLAGVIGKILYNVLI